MSGFQLLMQPKDFVYRYDGSLAGFYCCVHACVYNREQPLDIQGEGEPQMSLLPPRQIDTDFSKAARVRQAVVKRISHRALELCEHVFLSCLPRKEIAMLHFLTLGFSMGSSVTNHLTEPVVDQLIQAEKRLLMEVHLLSGFIRFADCDGRLLAAITPKNFVLPLLAPHFADRYSQESLLIYDRTHKIALVYEKGRCELAALEGEWPEFSETERFYQELWKRFYQTIAIQPRANARCRMTHMPKRYWENMTEMQPLLQDEQNQSRLHTLEGKGVGAYERNILQP